VEPWRSRSAGDRHRIRFNDAGVADGAGSLAFRSEAIQTAGRHQVSPETETPNRAWRTPSTTASD
jgi:hypothetical protein